MTRIDQVRCLWEEWKVAQIKAQEQGNTLKEVECNGAIKALDATLRILKRSSNTRMQTGACQCQYPYPDTAPTFNGLVCCSCLLPRR